MQPGALVPLQGIRGQQLFVKRGKLGGLLEEAGLGHINSDGSAYTAASDRSVNSRASLESLHSFPSTISLFLHIGGAERY